MVTCPLPLFVVVIFAPAAIVIVSELVMVESLPVVEAKVILSNGLELVMVKVSVALPTVVIPLPCANVAVLAEFLNLYLLPPSLTTTTLYVFVGAAPPANQFHVT